jgi:hypothetical protein
MKKFDREKVFAEVDASSKRFDKYSEEERRKFREEARKVREAADESDRISRDNMMMAAIICCMS